MSKDTPATQTSPQLITHPPNNMAVGMGFPFPIIHPQIGQFIPMGMLPINSNTMQHYMEVASKSGFGPAMVAPMIGSSTVIPPNMFVNQGGAKLGNDFANMSQKESEQNQTRDQASGNLVSRQEVIRTISSSNVHSIGGDRTPILPMPSVFFLPFTPGGITQYLPNYPAFSAVATPKKDDVPPRDHKPEQGLSLPNKCDEAKDSDELDVARILVDMQIPVLKKIHSHVTTSGSQSVTVKQDLNPARIISDQKTGSKDVKNSILQASVSKDISSDAKQQNGVDVLINTTPAFQHHHEQDDKHLEKPFPSKCDINTVNDQCSEKSMEREHESLDPDEVRPKEMELEEKEVEDPAEMKLEVISEGEICKPEPIHLMDGKGHDQAISNDVKMIQTPDYSDFNSLGHYRSKERCLLEHLEESPCIKREVIDISSDQNPVAESTVLSSSASSSSASVTTSFPSEQSMADLEKESALKQDSPEKQKDKLEEVKDINSEPADELSGDENGLSRKVYRCDVCSQLFRSPLGLQKHIEFHNMDDGKHYTCTICFMHFCNDTALQEHHEKHMRKRPHKCEFCPKAFRDPGSLQKHVRVHTGEKPYNCKDCHRSFAEYSSLRKHQRVHTGEQPYKCKYCSKAFSISGNLQRHILIHTGERPYKCNFCTKAFNNPSHLRRHVKNLHFKGDSAIDEAMLSHYGNPGATKTFENESSLQTNAEEKMKQDSQAVTYVDSRENDVPNTESLELGTNSVIIQAL